MLKKITRWLVICTAALTLGLAGVITATKPAAAVNMWVKNSSSSVHTASFKDNCRSVTAPPGATRILSCSGRKIWIPNETRVKGIGVGYWANTCGNNGSAHWKSFSYNFSVTFTYYRC